MSRKIVLGIDGGGTTTRVVAAERNGRLLASAQGGSASLSKSVHAKENVQQTLQAALNQAGRTTADVAALVAGLAGLNTPEDEAWAAEFTALPGLACPRLHVNDAVTAHAGALGTRPGIIAIAGTGSIVFGLTEAGNALRNYDFHHAPGTSARHLAYGAVHRLLAEEAQPGDLAFLRQVLEFWQVSTLEELRRQGTHGFIHDRFERNQRFGEMAPLVTAAAESGSPLAGRVCDEAAETLCLGVRLIGGCFTGPVVPVVLIGAAIRSAYMQAGMVHGLSKDNSSASPNRSYLITEPEAAGEIGAVQMALRLFKQSSEAILLMLTTLRNQ